MATGIESHRDRAAVSLYGDTLCTSQTTCSHMLQWCLSMHVWQTMEPSLVFLRRALWLVCLSVVVASVVIMEVNNVSTTVASTSEHAVHEEGDFECNVPWCAPVTLLCVHRQ
jgi:hypothetical protein